MFCVKCGTPVQQGAAPPPTSAPPSWQSRREERRAQRRNEKQEKYEKHEKAEKHEKGEKQEKGTLGGALIGGLVLIFLGVVFFLAHYFSFSASNWWALIFVVLGFFLVVNDLYYIAKGARRGAGIIGGLILLTIGYALYTNITYWWPLVLVAIGLGIIASAVLAHSGNPVPKSTV